MSRVQHIEIYKDVVEQRIDNYLFGKFSKLPKSLIYRWIRKGDLRVNKKRVKQITRVNSGDVIRMPPFTLDDNQVEAKVSQSHLDFLERRIIYENEDYMIVNKPSGMAVHGGSGVSSGLVERIRQLRPKARRVDLVHRLDKETSGCVILAKKHTSLVSFFNLFKERKIEKIYYAIVHGKWDRTVKVIDLNLKCTKTKDGQKVIKVDSVGGKKAVTHVLSVKYLNAEFSLLAVKLETGRTHQIRVHCKAKGHPIVADKKYGAFEKDDKLLSRGINRLLLHASKLEFFDEKQAKLISVNAILDDRFNNEIYTT